MGMRGVFGMKGCKGVRKENGLANEPMVCQYLQFLIII